MARQAARTPAKNNAYYRVGGKEEAFNEWQARCNETEAFAFENEFPADRAAAKTWLSRSFALFFHLPYQAVLRGKHAPDVEATLL